MKNKSVINPNFSIGNLIIFFSENDHRIFASAMLFLTPTASDIVNAKVRLLVCLALFYVITDYWKAKKDTKEDIFKF